MTTGIRSFEERQIATFKHQPVERIVWQPRFSDWYLQNHIAKLKPELSDQELSKFHFHCPDLPKEIFGMARDEIYDYLNASPRYIGECWSGLQLFYATEDKESDIKHKYHTDSQGTRFHKIITPHGELQESWRQGSSYPDERILKSKDDFKAVLYYLKSQIKEYHFNEFIFEAFRDVNEGRTVSTAGIWRSPYNKCIVELAGTRNTMLLMKRYTKEFDEFCAELEKIALKKMLPVILDSPIEFISIGDNVDCRNNPPPVYEKYQLPYFRKVAQMCKAAGKFTHAHFDGNLAYLLPYLDNDTYPFDGIEAPTVLPQGDVSLQEFRKALGDKIIVLDGIPSTIFLPHFSEAKFVDLVHDVIQAFQPNLILGVSDEYSPNGLFKRLEMVSSIVEEYDD